MEPAKIISGISSGFLGIAGREHIAPYTQWAQVGGYFDGDGCAHVRTDSPVVLRFTLVWVDNYREQLQQLRTFLLSKGIAVGNVLKHSTGAFMLQVASPSSVLAAAKQMVRFCFKKNRELEIVIGYYEDKIDGTTAMSKLNDLVRRGLRLGKVRKLIELPKYSEGKHIVSRARGLKSQELRRIRLSNQS